MAHGRISNAFGGRCRCFHPRPTWVWHGARCAGRGRAVDHCNRSRPPRPRPWRHAIGATAQRCAGPRRHANIFRGGGHKSARAGALSQIGLSTRGAAAKLLSHSHWADGGCAAFARGLDGGLTAQAPAFVYKSVDLRRAVATITPSFQPRLTAAQGHGPLRQTWGNNTDDHYAKTV